ncbi:MAG: LysR family transcriptional regulator [Burkholderiaceae bacterium]|nr:MAG: LysR family transcriptional regulator [Burkholderiaceae bacterium]
MPKPVPSTQHQRQRDAIAAEQSEAAADGHTVRACLPQDEGRAWPLPTTAKRLPPLIALSYFEAAARTQSFAAAAKELHVTPAAISHQIKALEELLGVELFVRHHRKVSLAPAAKAALPTLQDGFAALAEAVDQIRAHSEARWIITVCAEPLFATKWLVPRLHRFYARCPEAEVRLQASLSSVDSARGGPTGPTTFRRAGIDLAVRFGYGEYAELDARRLMAVSLVPVCAPTMAKLRPFASPHALLKQRLLSDSTAYRSPERFGWAQWFQHVGVSVPASLREQRFGNGLLALEAAVTGQGLLLACPQLVQAELQAGSLVMASDAEMPCPFAYFVVCQPSALDRPIVQAFRDWLFEEAVASAEPSALAVQGRQKNTSARLRGIQTA